MFYITFVRSPYEPELIEVIALQGMPKAVRYRKRVLQVEEIVNGWRIDEEWWRKPISRPYYETTFTSGSRFTIFRI